MAADPDKMIEIMISEIGEMTIALRPPLPFEAEGYRFNDKYVEIFGQGEKISLTLSEDIIGDAYETNQALLLEFGGNGSDPERETDLLRE